MWSSLFVSFYNEIAEEATWLSAQRVFKSAEDEFFQILETLQRVEKIDKAIKDHPDLIVRATTLLDDFQSCRSVFEKWLLKKKDEVPRLLWLQDHELINFYFFWMTSFGMRER